MCLSIKETFINATQPKKKNKVKRCAHCWDNNNRLINMQDADQHNTFYFKRNQYSVLICILKYIIASSEFQMALLGYASKFYLTKTINSFYADIG